MVTTIMKVRKSDSKGGLMVTVPKSSNLKIGDYVEITKVRTGLDYEENTSIKD